jgi:hypothetical protein
MTEEGVTGTFFVIGEKARSLEKRGRTDVIQAMARHDIGSHTNLGSIHPTVTERLEKMDWNEGVVKMLEDESKGFEELERIFQVPISSFARHGGSYGPQLVQALSQLGKGYVYSPISLPGHNAVWFCNTLNFHGEYGGFDDAYFRDELFNPLYDSVQVWLPKLIEESDVISFFGCHPCKVRTEQFWDFNYYEGANPDAANWRTPELRPQASMKTAQKNFRKLMKYLKSRKDIEITTYRKLMSKYSKQKEEISSAELLKIAKKINETKSIVMDSYFSPAEIFYFLVQSIVAFNQTHFMPEKMARFSPLGPINKPNQDPELSEVTVSELEKLAEMAYTYVSDNGYLPAFLSLKEANIGTGSLFALFAQAYSDISSGNLSSKYQIPSFEVYPQTNINEIVRRVEGCKNWPVHRPDLDMSKIVELTKMQLWTLKPAHVL